MANINSDTILKCLEELQEILIQFKSTKTFKANLIYFTGPDDKDHVEIQCWNNGRKLVSYYPKDTDLKSEKDFSSFLKSKISIGFIQR